MYAAKDTAGFTLIELMVVITLLAVTAAGAIPSFTSFVRNNRLQAQAAEVKTCSTIPAAKPGCAARR